MTTMESDIASRPVASKQAVKDDLVRQGFLPIYVHDDLDSRVLVEGAIEAGCRVLEYTCRRHDAREMIPWIKKSFPRVAVVGATLVDGPRAEAHLQGRRANFLTIDQMVDLGVDGLVSFLRFRPETYEKYGRDLVMIPGVGTPNEGLEQLELGADFLKFTVGKPAGSDLVLSLRTGTHECLPIMVTSGLTPGKIPQFIQAGIVLCSAGFDLTLKEEREKGRPLTTRVVAARVRASLEAVAEARREHQPELYEAIKAGGENPLAAGPWVC